MNIRINVMTILMLVVGIIIGTIILFIYYFISSLICKNQIKKERRKFDDDTISSLQFQTKTIIKNVKRDYKLKIKEKDANVEIVFESILDLIKQIACLFYPDSKKPIGELTTRELVNAGNLIINDIRNYLPSLLEKKLFSVKLNKFIKKKSENKKIGIIDKMVQKTLNVAKYIGYKNGIPLLFNIVAKEIFKVYSGIGYDFYDEDDLKENKLMQSQNIK